MYLKHDRRLTEALVLYWQAIRQERRFPQRDEIIPEDISSHGQCDLTIKIAGYIYVMEIKRGTAAVEAATTATNKALSQITTRGYSQKYRGLPAKGLYEVGLIFDPEARNLVRADWRVISGTLAG